MSAGRKSVLGFIDILSAIALLILTSNKPLASSEEEFGGEPFHARSDRAEANEVVAQCHKEVDSSGAEDSAPSVAEPNRSGGVEGDIELLLKIAEGYEANFAKLQTWKGEAIVTSASTHTPREYVDADTGVRRAAPVIYYSRRKAFFAYDSKLGAVRWAYELLERADVADGKKKKWEPEIEYGMKKDARAYYMHVGPEELKDKQKRRTMYIWPKERLSGSPFSTYFDPIEIVTAPERDVPARMRFFYKNAKNRHLASWTIKRQGDLVSVGTERSVINRYIFDLSKGCSLVEYFGQGSSVSAKYIYDFEPIGGVFVHKKLVWINQNRRADRMSTTMREIVFTNNIVNAPLDPQEFEFDRIGLRPGDRVHDTIEGGKYRWTGSKLQKPPKKPKTFLQKIFGEK